MHKRPLVALALLLASTVSAQAEPSTDPLQAAGARLQAALAKTAAQNDTAFEAAWGPDKKKEGDDDPFMAAMMGSMRGKAHGSWHPGLLHCVFEGEEGDELLVAGGRMLAKDGKLPWALRSGRFADGNKIPFLPEVPLLLQLLAKRDLTVLHREVASIDDRPVEILTVTLKPEHVVEMAWAGALPSSMTEGGLVGMQIRMLVGGQGGRQAVTPPDCTVDMAIALDPATGLVHQVRLRSWNKANAVGGARQVFVARGGAVQVAGGGDDEDEEEEEGGEAAADAKANDANAAKPGLAMKDGLPVRPRKKMSVTDYTVRLRNHGAAAAPALDVELLEGLGR